uniref:Uncharacterized protein n=1 Tax=Anguilla anguilla TaxID=7936 RepID=A0A0E9Q6U8_ANGAN
MRVFLHFIYYVFQLLN